MESTPQNELGEAPSPEPTAVPSAHEGSTRRRFDFYGCLVEVVSEQPSLVEDVRRDFTYFAAEGSDATQPGIRVELRLEPPSFAGLPAVPATVVTPRNVCFRDGDRVYVDYFGRALGVHDRERGHFTVSGTNHDLLHEAAYLHILSAVGQYLDGIGLHRVHALGVRHEGGAILLVLPSGGGKSTTALELLRRPGFSLLGEDTPLVDRRGNVLPFPLRLGVRPNQRIDIPERFLRTVDRMEFDPKTLIDLEYFEEKLCEPGVAVEPRSLLIGERNLGETTAIVPLPRRRAIGAFVKYSVVGLGIYQGLEFLLERGPLDLVGKSGVVASRLYATARLVTRAPAYKFVMGRDISKNTERLLEFLKVDNAVA